MQRRMVAALLAVVCLFAGCANADLYPLGLTVTCKDLQVTVPGDFADLSAEAYAKDADFMYGRKTLVFVGLSEDKADLQDMTLAQYTDYVISGNDLSCAAAPAGDGYLFSYEKPVDNTVYTYVTATYESDSAFWIFQFYGPTADLQENQPEIDIILESIRKTS
ncbi:MAG: hypothetical protein IKB80_06535 [Oscillospiraceae bacterium]|nr:hypothetical protein [Oscillospiraceae bacterium]